MTSDADNMDIRDELNLRGTVFDALAAAAAANETHGPNCGLFAAGAAVEVLIENRQWTAPDDVAEIIAQQHPELAADIKSVLDARTCRCCRGPYTKANPHAGNYTCRDCIEARVQKAAAWIRKNAPEPTKPPALEIAAAYENAHLIAQDLLQILADQLAATHSQVAAAHGIAADMLLIVRDDVDRAPRPEDASWIHLRAMLATNEKLAVLIDVARALNRRRA